VSEHTPGPWDVDLNSSDGQWYIRPHRQGFMLAVIDPSAIQGNDWTHEANARLIAAAPDLLVALRFYADRENWRKTKTCDCIAGGLPGSADRTLMDIDGGDKARAAIAKAEGEK